MAKTLDWSPDDLRGPARARPQCVTPEKVDLVTVVLDIENVGDQIAV